MRFSSDIPTSHEKRPDLCFGQLSKPSEIIAKARELIELSNSVKPGSTEEERLADFLAEGSFTIEDTPAGKIAIANTTGTRKPVAKFFRYVMRAKIRQNIN